MGNLKLYRKGWEYQMVLGLPTRNVKMVEIENEILKAKDLFNPYSLKSANKKEITHCKVDVENDVLELTLFSEQRLPVAIRGLKLLTTKVVELIQQRNDGKELLDKIIRRRSLFQTISVEEIDKTLPKETEDKENSFTILTNDLHGIEELKKKTFEMIRFYLKCAESNELLLANKEVINNSYKLVRGDESI